MIIKGSETGQTCVLFMITILVCAGAYVHPSLGESIILHTQQSYIIPGNITLVVEDVNPSAGVVWLKLYRGNDTLKSAILNVGGYFRYGDTNLTVNKIYAGDDHDLVELEIFKEMTTN
jgi:hypothetical protein